MKKLIKKHFNPHREKILYLLVGGWNTIFGYGTFVALYYLLHHYIHYLFILIVTNIITITNAYIGYKIVVFRTKGNYLREYLRYYLVYGVSFIINLILLPIAVELLQLSPVIAQAIIMMLTIIISFLGHKHFSFKA